MANIVATYWKLDALAAPDSGATDGEREAARAAMQRIVDANGGIVPPKPRNDDDVPPCFLYDMSTPEGIKAYMNHLFPGWGSFWDQVVRDQAEGRNPWGSYAGHERDAKEQAAYFDQPDPEDLPPPYTGVNAGQYTWAGQTWSVLPEYFNVEIDVDPERIDRLFKTIWRTLKLLRFGEERVLHASILIDEDTYELLNYVLAAENHLRIEWSMCSRPLHVTKHDLGSKLWIIANDRVPDA